MALLGLKGIDLEKPGSGTPCLEVEKYHDGADFLILKETGGRGLLLGPGIEGQDKKDGPAQVSRPVLNLHLQGEMDEGQTLSCAGI